MYEVIYERLNGSVIQLLVGATLPSQAIELAEKSDTQWKRVVFIKNQTGQVWFIREVA